MGTKVYFPNLDGLRTIACLMVFSFHALGMGHNRLGIQNEWLEKMLLAFLNGKTGVSIFFVLSGFLITYIILAEIREKGSFSLGHFYIRRVLRIWPLYFGVLLVIFVLIPVADQFLSVSRSTADTRPFYYFTFLSNFDVLRILENGKSDFLPATITWSVAIEEQFYLFWPLLFLVIPAVHYKYLFISMILLAFCFRLFHYNQVYQLYFHSFSAVFDLSVGGAAAWLCSTQSRFKSFIAGIPDRQRILVLAAGIGILYTNVLVHQPLVNLLLNVVQVFFFAFIIVDQCFNRSERFKLSASKLLSRLGKYTYGMYMLHPLVLLVINIIMVRIIHKPVESLYTVAACFFAGLPLTIGLAAGSYKYIEKRFLVLKDRFSFVSVSPVGG